MVIRQGDVFWVTLSEPTGSSPGYRHPHVVVQNNLFNDSRMNTTVVCTLTSNLKRTEAPGNVLLEAKESGLPKPSVVVVSQLFTVDKSDLTDHVATLSKRRVRQILDGIRLIVEPRETDDKPNAL
jgi:mRNA interferase MazF